MASGDAFFYVLISASLLHALVSVGFFVRQRKVFPVHGHDIALTTIMGVCYAFMLAYFCLPSVCGDTCYRNAAVLPEAMLCLHVLGILLDNAGSCKCGPRYVCLHHMLCKYSPHRR